GSQIPQSQNGGSVGDDGNKIAPRGVAKHIFRVCRDRPTRLRDTRRIGKRQVALREGGLGGMNGDFAWPTAAVIVQGILLEAWHRIERSQFSEIAAMERSPQGETSPCRDMRSPARQAVQTLH